MVNIKYLWQIGLIAASSVTVSGAVQTADGTTRRFSFTVTTTAHNLKYLLENATGGSKWSNDLKGIELYNVGNDIYANAGWRSATDGDVIEATTTADRRIEAGDYSTSPLDLVDFIESSSGSKKVIRVWDTESFEGTADVTGDAINFATAFPAQTGVYIKNTDSAGTLYLGVGLDASELSSTFPGVDLGPGDWAEIPCGASQGIAAKASTGTIAYCAQRFSE